MEHAVTSHLVTAADLHLLKEHSGGKRSTAELTPAEHTTAQHTQGDDGQPGIERYRLGGPIPQGQWHQAQAGTVIPEDFEILHAPLHRHW